MVAEEAEKQKSLKFNLHTTTIDLPPPNPMAENDFALAKMEER